MIVQTNAHIGFVCKDLEKSIKFYEEVLGLREKFTLYYGGKEKFGIDHIDIVVDDIQEFKQELIDKGAEEYIDIQPGPSICRSFTMWLHDPDGNQIEVHQYTDLSMQIIGRDLPEGVTWTP